MKSKRSIADLQKKDSIQLIARNELNTLKGGSGITHDIIVWP